MSAPLSKTARLLKYLQSGKSITPLQAWKKFGLYRCADAVYKLNRRGHTIVNESATEKGETFARYKMNLSKLITHSKLKQ